MEVKCTIKEMYLNHPETIPLPPRSTDKLSSTKLVPGAKKVGKQVDLMNMEFLFGKMKNLLMGCTTLLMCLMPLSCNFKMVHFMLYIFHPKTF